MTSEQQSQSLKPINDVIRNEIRKCIHDWIQIDDEIAPHIARIDDEIKQLAVQRKELTARKKTLMDRKKVQTDRLLGIIKQQEVGSINIQGGKLVYKKKISKNAISKKYLLNIVHEYYKDSSETAEKLTSFILDSRGEKVTELIERHGI